MNNKKITQIIPATGWYAEFEAHDDKNLFMPVICFALVQTGADFPTSQRQLTANQDIQGVSSDKDGFFFCENTKNFLQYVPEKDIDEGSLKRYVGKLEDALTEQKERQERE